jgi:hypothetical protein
MLDVHRWTVMTVRSNRPFIHGTTPFICGVLGQPSPYVCSSSLTVLNALATAFSLLLSLSPGLLLHPLLLCKPKSAMRNTFSNPPGPGASEELDHL